MASGEKEQAILVSCSLVNLSLFKTHENCVLTCSGRDFEDFVGQLSVQSSRVSLL